MSGEVKSIICVTKAYGKGKEPAPLSTYLQHGDDIRRAMGEIVTPRVISVIVVKTA
jgi:hypothetical protein